MRKVILVLVCLLGYTSNVFSQSTINKNDLIGYWIDDNKSTHLFFWKDTNGDLKTQEISATTGQPIDLIVSSTSFNIFFTPGSKSNNIDMKLIVFSVINKNKLKCVITGDVEDTIYFTKIK